MSAWSDFFRVLGSVLNPGSGESSASSVGDEPSDGLSPFQSLFRVMDYVFGDMGQAVENFGKSFGEGVNNLTGTTASNQFAAGESALAREHATAERLASQEFNSAEAQKSRDFQEYMESTRYQRLMDDLSASGVNPMAAFMSGSASPGSSSGSSAASVSGGSSAAGSASGNSAAAVSGFIKSVASVVRAAASDEGKGDSATSIIGAISRLISKSR